MRFEFKINKPEEINGPKTLSGTWFEAEYAAIIQYIIIIYNII